MSIVWSSCPAFSAMNRRLNAEESAAEPIEAGRDRCSERSTSVPDQSGPVAGICAGLAASAPGTWTYPPVMLRPRRAQERRMASRCARARDPTGVAALTHKYRIAVRLRASLRREGGRMRLRRHLWSSRAKARRCAALASACGEASVGRAPGWDDCTAAGSLRRRGSAIAPRWHAPRRPAGAFTSPCGRPRPLPPLQAGHPSPVRCGPGDARRLSWVSRKIRSLSR